jgi:hypothetical protein
MFELFIALVNHLGVKSTSSPRGFPISTTRFVLTDSR